jgi:hypothetical protein
LTIEERLDAIAMNHELTSHDLRDLTAIVAKLADAVDRTTTNVTNLSLIVERHERRIQGLEGQ